MKKNKMLMVFFGLTGSGKTYLAGRYAAVTGGVCFNTDVVRKQLAGIVPTKQCRDGLGSGIYSAEFSRKTYDALLEQAAVALDGSYSVVILDGSFHLQKERQRVIDTFGSKYSVFFVYCFCSEQVTRQRLHQRLGDQHAVSDGRLEVYQAQLKNFEYPLELGAGQLLELDTDAAIEYLVESLEQFVSPASPNTEEATS